MKEPVQSPERQRAVSLDMNRCICAGAGSGKTSTLVEASARLLEGSTPLGPLSLEQILAITFTDKAANEMKDRIRCKIEERLLEAREPNEFRLWEEARRMLFRANISTFHSFCSRLLRENPVEAGLDPDFEVADQIRSGQVLEEETRNLIMKRIRDRDPAFAALVEEFGFITLQEMLRDILGKLRNAGIDAASARQRALLQEKEMEAELARSKADLQNLLKSVFEKKRLGRIDPRSKAFQSISRLEESQEEIDSLLWADPLEFGVGRQEILSEIKKTFSGSVPRIIQDEKKKIEQLLDLKEGSLALLANFFSSLPTQRRFANALELLEGIYSKRKISDSTLDYDDLLHLARNLLRDNLEVRQRYKLSYRVILVDEFQDTNDLQREIVYLLAEREDICRKYSADSIENIELQSGKLFIVGDPKQSIYLFRGADVAVFNRVMFDMKSRGGEVITFQENFRSLEEILSVVNPLFAELIPQPQKSFHVPYRPEDHLKPTRFLPHPDCRVEMIFLSGKDGEPLHKITAFEARRLEAVAIARRILQFVDPDSGSLLGADSGNPVPVRFGDITILLRSMQDIKVYEHALREHNVPYYVVKGRGFFKCQEILDIINLLEFLQGAHLGKSLAGILRSPLFGCSDETLLALAYDEEGRPRDIARAFFEASVDSIPPEEREKILFARETLTRIRKIKDRLSIRELLNEILACTGYPSVLLSTFQGEQKAANLQKLVEVARVYESLELQGLDDFVRHLERMVQTQPLEAEAQISSEESQVVKIMSIHQAKGLEFPVVFLADIGRSRKQPVWDAIASAERGLAVRARDPSTLKPRNNYLVNLLKEEYREREDAEDMRIFYVALTRAKDYLVLSGETVRKGSCWRVWLNNFLGPGEIGDFLTSADRDEKILVKEMPGPFAPYTVRVRLVKSHSIPHLQRESIALSAADILRELDEKASDESPLGVVEMAARRSLDFTVPRVRRLILSPTSYITYRFCPARYYYGSLLRMQRESLAREEDRFGWEISRAELEGSVVHRFLEHVDLTSSREAQISFLERFLKGLLLEEERLEASITVLREDLGRVLSEKWFEKLKGPAQARKVFREFPFYCPISGSDGFTIVLTGAIDLLLQDEEDEWSLVDYKYAHKKDRSLLPYDEQLLLYALAVFTGAKIPQISSHLVFLKDDPTTFVPVDSSPQILKNFKKRLIEMAQGIVKKMSSCREDAWEKAEKGSCHKLACPFMLRCWGSIDPF